MHHYARTHTSILAALLLGLSLFAVQPATAQSDNDLRRENQRLRSELDDVTRALSAARERIEELEEQVERLERLLEAPGGTPAGDGPAPREEVSIDESDPAASPRAMLRGLSDHYAEHLGELEIGQPGDRTRSLYLRQLNRWQAAAVREFRTPIEWHVRVTESNQTRSGFELTMVAVDPKTDVRLGEPFDVRLPRGIARRYEQITQQSSDSVLVLRGIASPEITINRNRQTSGPFDNPKLIGPFAEFRLDIEPRSLLAVGEEE